MLVRPHQDRYPEDPKLCERSYSEKARRAEEAAAIRAQWGLSKDEKAGPACARKLEALAKKWPDNAKLRMRSDEFPFWWP